MCAGLVYINPNFLQTFVASSLKVATSYIQIAA